MTEPEEIVVTVAGCTVRVTGAAGVTVNGRRYTQSSSQCARNTPDARVIHAAEVFARRRAEVIE